ncbi:MAG TPA: OB-fold nucleic acid binding domain-containing protein, partial [Candidatus Sabulitectum sp.]|nr:OB-fold nucleic acid binding domain-containing protein [Candidatus Sabulitectum sp.]
MYRIAAGEGLETISAEKLMTMDGETVEVHGMVQRIRRLGWGAFIVLRRHDGLLQCVMGRDGNEEIIDSLLEEQSVAISGKVSQAKIKDKSIYPDTVEIQVESLKV